VEDVLIVAGKEEDAIAAERASEGEAELVLLAVGLDLEEGIAGVEGAICAGNRIRCREICWIRIS